MDNRGWIARVTVGGALWFGAVVSACGGDDAVTAPGDASVQDGPSIRTMDAATGVDSTMPPPADASTCGANQTTCGGHCVEVASDRSQHMREPLEDVQLEASLEVDESETQVLWTIAQSQPGEKLAYECTLSAVGLAPDQQVGKIGQVRPQRSMPCHPQPEGQQPCGLRPWP